MNQDKFGMTQFNSSTQPPRQSEVRKSRTALYLLLIVIILLLLGCCLFFSSSTFVVPNFLNTNSENLGSIGISGTPDRVIVQPDSNGNVTLLTPQPIATNSSPTFNGLTLTGMNGNVRAENGLLVTGALDLSNTDQVTNVLGVENGGTGLSATPSNGQILVGGTDGYSLKSLVAGNNIIITNTADSIIINSTAGGGNGVTTTITPGEGLIGSSALGPGMVTLNVGQGNGILVGPDNITVNLNTSGTTSNASSNSGLEVNADGLRLLGGCSDGEILKWNAGTIVWECSSDIGAAGSMVTELNGLTSSTQTFATGTAGLDFNISSVGTVHTFNIPSASTTARGLVTTGAQTFGGNKTFNNNLLVNGNTTVGDASSDAVTFNALVNSNFSPFVDNTYNLGSLDNRWQDLYLGPSSLNITSTTGTSGSGANYVLGTLGYSGSTLELATSNVGSSNGGALSFLSALPNGSASSAFRFNTLNNLGSNDGLFQLADNNSNYLTYYGNGWGDYTPDAISSGTGHIFTMTATNNSTTVSSESSFFRIVGTQDLNQVGNPYQRTAAIQLDMTAADTSNGGYLTGVASNLYIESPFSRGGGGFFTLIDVAAGSTISSSINGFSSQITNYGTLDNDSGLYAAVRNIGGTLTNYYDAFTEYLGYADGMVFNYGGVDRMDIIDLRSYNYGDIYEDYRGFYLIHKNYGNATNQYNGFFQDLYVGGGGSVGAGFYGNQTIMTVEDGIINGNVTGNYVSLSLSGSASISGDVIGQHIDFGSPGADVDNAYGLYIDSLSQGSERNYGIYIDGVSGGSILNYSLYVNSGLARFAPATNDNASINLASSEGVNPTSPQSGDLWWNGTELNFRAGGSTINLLNLGGGAVALADLVDVDLSGLADGNFLSYDNDSSLWIPVAAPEGSSGVTSITAGNGLAGGVITSSGTISIDAPTCNTGEALTWNGSAFSCISVGEGGGSGAIYASWDPFAPPTNTNGYGYTVLSESDEFSPGTLDASWSTYDHNSIMTSVSTIQGKLVLELEADSSPWAGIYKSLPETEEWTIETHVKMQSEAFEFRSVGLGLFSDAANNSDLHVIRLTREQDGAIRTDHYNDDTEWDSVLGYVSKNWSAEEAFFRVTYDGTDYRFYWSLDGTVWNLVKSENNMFMSPSEFGLIARYDADGDHPLWAIFDFVRVYDTALSSNVPVQGQMVDKGTGSGIVATTLASLSDVDLTGLTGGSILMYNAGLSKWEITSGGGSSVLFAPNSAQINNSGRSLINLEYSGEPSGIFTDPALIYVNNTEYNNDLYSYPNFLQFDSSDYGGTVFSVNWDGTTHIANDLYVNGFAEITGGAILGYLDAEGATDLCLNDNNWISTCSSSKRYKHDIQNLNMGLNTVLNLRPVTFNWNASGIEDLGFIAEEVYEVNPLLVIYNANGEIEGVKYKQLTALLVNAVKEMNQRIEDLEEKVADIDRRLSNLEIEERMKSGNITIPNGVTEINVVIENFDKKSRVLLTPKTLLNNGINYYVINREDGFIIKLSSPVLSEVAFDYLIIKN